MMASALSKSFFPAYSNCLRKQHVLADRAQGGLGIGLSLVKSIVQFHGGNVTAESGGAGAGTKFTVSLPRHIELRTAVSPSGKALVLPIAKALRIMIVDDNKDATRYAVRCYWMPQDMIP